VLAAVLGVVLSAGVYGFLQAVSHLQTVLCTDLPNGLGFHGAPTWWPLPLLAVAGLLVGLTVQYLPGNGGHQPAEGLKTTAMTAGAFASPASSLHRVGRPGADCVTAPGFARLLRYDKTTRRPCWGSRDRRPGGSGA
jgi:hypothetical protein